MNYVSYWILEGMTIRVPSDKRQFSVISISNWHRWHFLCYRGTCSIVIV